jgi:iron complex outermembrane receptor protein
VTFATLAGTVPASAEITQILVTAQRRGEESLQNVPIAVSAFDATQISNLQIDAVKDIGANVPNLQTYTVTAGAEALQLHSRGTSVQNPGFNLSESPVGIYLDDVYYGRLASANLDLADIERIEVLRGPQGTLYGRNTIAGAVKIITRTPGDEMWANASVGIGNYETTRLTGSFGGPIEPGALAGSISLLYDDRNDGWQNNPITGASPGEYENKLARAKLHWYGSEGVDAVLGAWAVDGENDGYNGIPYNPFSNTGPNANFDPAPAASAPLGDFYDNFSPAGVNYGDTSQAGVNLALSFDLGALTLRSITGYADIEDDFGFDLAGGGNDSDFDGNANAGVPGLLISSDGQLDQLSQEFQLLGTAMQGRLDWLVGVFYLNEDGEQRFSGTLTGAGDFSEFIENETDSYAAFFDGTYNLSDALAVTAGLRWTRDDKEFTDTCTDSFPPGTDDLPFIVPGGTGPILQCRPGDSGVSVDLDDDWDEVTGKLGVDYRLSPQQLVYASWAQGFQAGGFRTLCFGNLTPLCGGTTFDPQTVDSFELGYKADLFDNTLRFNATAFYAMYDDIQQIVTNNAGGFPIDNIGEVDVYGLELEVTWVPVDNLRVFALLGTQESDFGKVDPLSPPGGLGDSCAVDPAPPCAPPTSELPSNPSWQGKVGFNYTIDLAGSVKFHYGLDVTHTDEYFSEARNLLQIDDYTRLNGIVGIADDNDRWQVALSGTNITDEEDNVSGIFANAFTNIRTVLPPAEYMLTFRASY